MTQQHVMPRWFRWAGVAAFVLIVLALVVVPSGGRLYAEPAGTVDMYIQPATRAVPVNGQVTVQVKADLNGQMDTNGLGAYEFDLLYDANYLDATSISDAGGLDDTGRTVEGLGPVDVTGGKAAGAYSYDDVNNPQLDGPTGNGIALANVTVQANKAGVTTLTLTNTLLVDTQANAWPDGGANVLNTQGASIFIFLHSDFDGDGVADPAAYRPNTKKVEAYLSGSSYAKFTQWVGDGVPVVADYDGDGKADPAAYRDGKIIAWLSGSSYSRTEWAVWANAQPAVGDYDGDGKADPAVYASGGTLLVRRSSQSYDWFKKFIGGNATPLVGDYDGDGKADPARYRNGQILVRRSSFGYDWFKRWVGSNAIPLVGDYDGDGKADLAAYREWDCKILVRRSSFGYDWFKRFVGCSGTIPLAADYDGDGKVDLASYRNGKMLIRRSSLGYDWFRKWVGSNATPIVGDYDGDGLADPAAYRSDGNILAHSSSSNYSWTQVLRQWVGSSATPVAYWRLH